MSPSSSIPPSILSLPHRWAAAWSQPSPTPWLDLYHSKATYTDHAFQIIRQGRSILERHFNLWRTANPDFIMTVDDSRPIFWEDDGEGQSKVVRCSFRTVNKGTWENDLHVYKASGKRFVFIGVIDLVVERETGLILELDEWYTNNRFDTMDQEVGLAGYGTLRSDGAK